jgi:hypothetical protein
MKKIFLLAIFYFVSSSYAQNRIENTSPLLKKIKVENIQDPNFKFVQNASISWDFNGLELNNADFSIEVVTILDCFNGEQASEFKDQFSVLTKENFFLSGNTQLNHLELMAKCFKWRLVSKTSVTAVSDWFYFSFVK